MDPALTIDACRYSLLQALTMLSSSVVIGGLMLVERRGRGKPLNSKRQIDLQTLLNSIPDMVIIIAPGGVIVDANEAASRVSGIAHDSLVGMTMPVLAKHLNGEFANVVSFGKPVASRALEGEHVEQERRRFRNPATGEEMELILSANPIRTESGEVVGALLIGRDVTEMTQLQTRVADIERHQAIGHVAAGIAHDFNNTLQTISQAAAVLQMSDRPAAEQKYFLDMIQNAVRRGAEVIARIRDYLRSGTSVRGDVDVRSVMDEAAELTVPLLRSNSIEIQKELSPSGAIRGNRADLLRMFTNLIVNGVQAMPQGGKIILGCEDVGGTVHAWVCDTGHGMSPEVRSRVFHPYFTTKAGGTGLGLSGAQKIMLELGGNISFSSEPGRGTQFDLTFPKTAAEERKTA